MNHILKRDIRKWDIACRLMDKTAFSDAQMRLRKLLRAMRQEAGLRQVDLAEQLGEPQSFVSKYESGERRLDLVEVSEVCKALGTTLSELARRFEESSP